jgi:hypothetical protein
LELLSRARKRLALPAIFSLEGWRASFFHIAASAEIPLPGATLV